MVGTREPEPTLPLDGTRVLFGKYLILRELGRGGFGEVYLVRHVELGWELAMKVLRADVASEPGRRESFLKEMQTIRGLVHAKGVVIRDAGYAEGRLYFTMDYVAGDTLRTVFSREKRIAPERMVRWASDALEYLEVLHGERLVHRDLKPENLMLVTKDGREEVRVLDLGIAKEYLDEAGRVQDVSMIIGTVPYMAPEQRAGHRVDPRTDIYALGLIAYEGLTGARPEFVDGIVKAPPSQVVPGVSKEVDAALLKALHPTPANRFQSASEFRAALIGHRSSRRYGLAVGATVVLLGAGISLREPIARVLSPPVDHTPPALISTEPPDLTLVGGDRVFVTIEANETLGEGTRLGEATGELDGRRARFTLPLAPVARSTELKLELSLVDAHGNRSMPTWLRLRQAPEATLRFSAPDPDARVGRDCEVVVAATGAEPLLIRIGTQDVPVQNGLAIAQVALPAHGRHVLEAELTDGLDRSARASLVLVSDQEPPRWAALAPLATWEPRTRISVHADEALSTETRIDDGTVELSDDRRTAWRDVDVGTRRVPIELVDELGNRVGTHVALRRLTVPDGFEAIPGETSEDSFGLDLATPIREPSSGIVLCLVPATGASGFHLGAVPGDRAADPQEQPRVQVVIRRPYYLGRSEVTWNEWRRCEVAGIARSTPLDPDLAEHPVTNVTSEQAESYCRELGLRLPTEAEWEWACRFESPDGIYLWGDDAAQGLGRVNVLDQSRIAAGKGDAADAAPFSDGFVSTCPVREFAPSPRLGLYGLLGNAMELCQDRHDSGTYAAWARSVPMMDPCRRDESETHVARGGSFRFGMRDVRISRRFRQPDDKTFDDVGFRVACSAPLR